MRVLSFRWLYQASLAAKPDCPARNATRRDSAGCQWSLLVGHPLDKLPGLLVWLYSLEPKLIQAQVPVYCHHDLR